MKGCTVFLFCPRSLNIHQHLTPERSEREKERQGERGRGRERERESERNREEAPVEL